MRTGLGVVAIVAVAALIANALGGDKAGDPDNPIAKVAFVHTDNGSTDVGTPNKGTVRKESAVIAELLNEWYQTAFVDTENFGDGTFPTIAARFTKDAKTAFTRDTSSLTIGDARTLVSRVDPSAAKAVITIYLDRGKTPTFAVATVNFAARATQKKKGQPAIAIRNTATLHLQKFGDDWLVTYYTANTSEKPIQPAPSGSPSS
jgi:hypothetical protein